MKGIIALDIDGTLTVEMEPPPASVIHYLHQLVDAGWCLVFVTGRTFHWGYEALKNLDFPYHYAVQNGAAILRMPEKELVLKNYLNKKMLPQLEKICTDQPSDFVIYTGYEHGDRVLYRPDHFEPELLTYLEKRREAFREEWVAVDSFDDIEVKEFPSIKCFGKIESANTISERLQEQLKLDAPVIRDPFDSSYCVIQGTPSGINKGSVLHALKDELPFEGVVIAAGDDYNDLTMLQAADVKVAMASSPKELLDIADITAPPAAEQGIVVGLNRAMKLIRSHNG